MPEIKSPATLAPNMYLIKLKQNTYPKFAYYFYFSNTGKIQLILNDKSTTIGALYKDDVKNTFITYPSLDEQIQISEFLDKKTTQFDELIAKSKEQITILEEKRQALITAAVTGKIDVRN